MNKYVYRLIIGILVYYFFRVNQEQDYERFFEWDIPSFWYLVYTVLVIQVIWEILSRAIRHWKTSTSLIYNRGLYVLSIKATMLMLPFILLFSYLFVYYLKMDCGCMEHIEETSQFWMTSTQGFVIGLLVIAHEIIRIYVRSAVSHAREKELIEKELISAKFEGLKRQVNPHFLFNSFSVLSSLVEKDAVLAQKFIDKLSDMYRYILEHENQDLVSLHKEIDFLDDYIFLMQIRYPIGLQINKSLAGLGAEVLVPPMSLQILVENAIKHNSFSKDKPLVITIESEGSDFILVENPKSEKKELVPSTGIGLKNLSNRLMLSIKEGLHILDEPKRFRVKMPLRFHE